MKQNAKRQSPAVKAERVDVERERRYRRLYGIGVEDYETMLVAQGGGCAICGAEPKSRRLHVDHDHKTGQTRGLLCFHCNALLLRRGVTAARLARAAQYLETPPATAALGREVFGRTGPTKRRRRRR